ncbi:hypothetical protein [Solicola gregarius]|uniref:Sulfotransferase family protein n=1 Tax=Solicola gregarius TaxID=2908642 RepID=A0AA46TLD7_9ACTN|nr:hypothetical protein [Solicola gregarius]UYM07069.1 hypothetical protein L0C25_08335 [Solicola gregarius]
MPRERPVIHLHIGAMKTGTTHLQELMTANADELAAAGCLFPVTKGRYSQTLAARDVMNMTADDVTLRRARGEWDRVVQEMLSYDGRAAIFSMEFLSFARRRPAGRIVGSFGDAPVHGILTVRDAATAIPAQWQQAMQSQRTTPWHEFAGQVIANPPDYSAAGARTFRRTQDIPRMLSAWLPHIPPEQFTVVTLPRPGAPRHLLWERFAAAVDLDPAVAKRSAPRNNESIGAASAELIRRINERLSDIAISDYRGTMRHALAIKILSDRVSTEGKAPVNNAFLEFAAAANARARAAIEESGVRVIGDLDDLPVEAPAPSLDDTALDSPSDADVIDAAAYAMPRMRRVVAQRAKQLRRAHQKVSVRKVLADLPEARDAEAVTKRWTSAADPAEAAVTDLTAMCRAAIDLGIRLRAAGVKRAVEA